MSSSPESNSPVHGTSPVPVAIYARVSTEHQVGTRYDSCAHQVAVCREFIGKNEQRRLYEAACYTDEACSGGNMARPGIRALMHSISVGAVKVVLIYRLERILRNTDEWGAFRSFLKRHDCRLISPSEDFSDETASGRLRTNMLVSFVEFERLNIAEKTRSKMLAQAQRGYWSGGMVPYGYDYDKNTQSLSPNPDEAAVVERIFRRVGQLIPLSVVANELTVDGIRTRIRTWGQRREPARTVGGHPFRSDVLRGMIQNPLYCGCVCFANEEYPGNHAPVVTREMWDLANATLNIKRSTRKPRLTGTERDKHTHL